MRDGIQNLLGSLCDSGSDPTRSSTACPWTLRLRRAGFLHPLAIAVVGVGDAVGGEGAVFDVVGDRLACPRVSKFTLQWALQF